MGVQSSKLLREYSPSKSTLFICLNLQFYCLRLSFFLITSSISLVTPKNLRQRFKNECFKIEFYWSFESRGGFLMSRFFSSRITLQRISSASSSQMANSLLLSISSKRLRTFCLSCEGYLAMMNLMFSSSWRSQYPKVVIQF